MVRQCLVDKFTEPRIASGSTIGKVGLTAIATCVHRGTGSSAGALGVSGAVTGQATVVKAINDVL